MLTMRETALGVFGAWRLANFDPRGMECFDRSLTGLWRSFRVAILVAPAFALLVYLNQVQAPPTADALRFVLAEGIAYVTSWVAFPLAVAYLAPVIDRVFEYPGFIVAYNWSSILQVAVFVPVAGITALDVLPPGVAEALYLATQLVVLTYEWFITKTALRLSGLAAAGIVLLDLVVSVLISVVAVRMA